MPTGDFKSANGDNLISVIYADLIIKWLSHVSQEEREKILDDMPIIRNLTIDDNPLLDYMRLRQKQSPR